MTDTAMSDIEMNNLTKDVNDDSDILDNIDENNSLLRNGGVKKVKKSNWQILCCKSFIIAFAVILFLAILVRSWSDYGTYITKHVFPPAVHSVSVQCQGYSENLFNAPLCSWNVTSTDCVELKCQLDKTNKWFIDITERDQADITWEDQLNIHFHKKISCTNLIIWSI